MTSGASRRFYVVALSSLVSACSDSGSAPSSATPTDGGTHDASSGGAGGRGAGGSSGGARTDSGKGAAGASSGGSDGAADAGRFKKNPALAGLGDETALDLGPFDCTPVDGEDPEFCRQATDYSGFVYDPHHNEMLLFGGGHATTMTDSIHSLDLGDTLKWKDLYPPTPCSSMTTSNVDMTNGAWVSGPAGPYPRPVSTHTYDMLGVSPLLDLFVVISRNFSGGTCNPVGNDIGGHIAHFDRTTNEWSFANAEGSTSELSVDIPGSEPDPVSGKIVLLSRSGLSLYDPAVGSYSHVSDTLNTSSGPQADLGNGYANHLVYFPPDDTFYYFVRSIPVKVYALKLDRNDPTQSTLDGVATTGPTSSHAEPGYDYDSKNHVIGGAVQDDTFYAFDPATKVWTSHTITKGGSPGSQAFHAVGYDPVDNVFIFVTDYNSGRHTWAYRLKR